MIFKMLDTSTMHRRWLGAIGARGVAPRERIMQAASADFATNLQQAG